MKHSFYTEKSQVSNKSPSHAQLSPTTPISNHKRTRTFDLRRTPMPQNTEYQLENKFASLGFLKRKDSCPDPLKELLKASDFSQTKKTIINGLPSNSQIQKKLSLKKKEITKGTVHMNNEFLKDLTRIYDNSSFKTSRTFKEYEKFFNMQYFALDKNIKTINHLDNKGLELSKEVYLSEEHRSILAQTMKNFEKSKVEMLS